MYSPSFLRPGFGLIVRFVLNAFSMTRARPGGFAGPPPPPYRNPYFSFDLSDRESHEQAAGCAARWTVHCISRCNHAKLSSKTDTCENYGNGFGTSCKHQRRSVSRVASLFQDTCADLHGLSGVMPFCKSWHGLAQQSDGSTLERASFAGCDKWSDSSAIDSRTMDSSSPYASVVNCDTLDFCMST